MRHLIYLLVVVNLVFFLWHAIQGPAVNEVERELPPLPAGVRPLVTLQEREQAAIEAATAAEPPGAGMPLACQSLGPFLTAAKLQAAQDRLEAAGYPGKQRTSEMDVQIGYWVYLPAMETGEAQAVAQLLDSQDDKEYLIGKDNVISLGAFKERSRAEIRLKSAREHGLDPLLEPRYRKRTVHWLDIDGPPVAGGELPLIIREFPDIQLQARACQ